MATEIVQLRVNQLIAQRDESLNALAMVGAEKEHYKELLAEMTERCKKAEDELDLLRDADNAPEVKEMPDKKGKK